MLYYIFIFIKCILEKSDLSKCKFVDSIRSLSTDKLQITSNNKDHFCNIHKTFDVTFESKSGSKNKIKKIPDDLFCDCFIGTLTLSEDITTISNASFLECRINEIKFHPKSKLIEISSYAFYRSQITKDIKFPCSLLNIGYFSFSRSILSSSITLPNSITSIGNSAFSYCSSLTSITLPNNIISIGNSAFSDCSSLTSITLSKKSFNYWRKCIYGMQKIRIDHN